MKMNLYAIFDSVSGAFDRPWCSYTDGSASRNFGDIINSGEGPMARHPDHYRLYRVGSWNDNTGKVVAEEEIEELVTGDKLVNTEN